MPIANATPAIEITLIVLPVINRPRNAANTQIGIPMEPIRVADQRTQEEAQHQHCQHGAYQEVLDDSVDRRSDIHHVIHAWIDDEAVLFHQAVVEFLNGLVGALKHLDDVGTRRFLDRHERLGFPVSEARCTDFRQPQFGVTHI